MKTTSCMQRAAVHLWSASLSCGSIVMRFSQDWRDTIPLENISTTLQVLYAASGWRNTHTRCGKKNLCVMLQSAMKILASCFIRASSYTNYDTINIRSGIVASTDNHNVAMYPNMPLIHFIPYRCLTRIFVRPLYWCFVHFIYLSPSRTVAYVRK